MPEMMVLHSLQCKVMAGMDASEQQISYVRLFEILVRMMYFSFFPVFMSTLPMKVFIEITFMEIFLDAFNFSSLVCDERLTLKFLLVCQTCCESTLVMYP